MTKVNITFAKENGLQNLDAGHYVKKDGRMYLIAMMEETIEDYADSIEGALFNNRPLNQYVYTKGSYRVRKYNAVNMSTGSLYLSENYKMTALIDKLQDAGFKKVSRIEISEVE